jgi:hypothetical protein
LSNRDHLNSKSASTDTRNCTSVSDPAGNLSIDNLDSSEICSACGSGVPSRCLHSITGLKSVEIDLSGSGDSAGESSVGSGESECQLTGGVLSLVDEGDVEREERIDVVVCGGGGDGTSELSSEGTVGFSLFDGDDQVGEQSRLGGGCGFGGGGGGSCGGATFVDSDCGGVVRRRWWVDSDGDCSGVSCGGGRRWVGCDSAGGDEGFL